MIIDDCEVCGGERAWPQVEGEYPWQAKLTNPCTCEPDDTDGEDICRDYQAEFAERQSAAQDPKR